MKRVYVSGPMSGIPLHNEPAFTKASKLLREKGYAVVSPSEMNGTKALTWEEFLIRDLSLLFHCDGIALLPGWEQSRGARLELAVAVKLGLYILDAFSLMPKHLEVDFNFRDIAFDQFTVDITNQH
jgi:hypothetical protein